MTWLKLRLNLRKALVGILLVCCFMMLTMIVVPGHFGASKSDPKRTHHLKQISEIDDEQLHKVQERILLRERQKLQERKHQKLQERKHQEHQERKHQEHRDGHEHDIVDGMVEEHLRQYLHKGHEGVLFSGKPANTTETSGCLNWVQRSPKPPYFLTAVLLVRIYKADKAALTTKEMKEWLLYLRYAGVEHVYVYDAWVLEEESQLSALRDFEEDGYITYIDWHTHNPYTISGTQVAAYQNCIDKYSGETTWQAAIDIDEYPFSPEDTAPGFLSRYIKHFSEYHPQVSEITMQNYLYLGKPLDKELMIERLFRRTHRPANPLVKPIYKPSHVRAQVHHNSLKKGRSMSAPGGELRMNHYWGARLQDWGEDTPDILAKTEPDYGIQQIITAFKECESYVRPYLE